MGKGAKIAIGCFVVLLAGAVIVTIGLVGGAYWLKGKAQQVTGNLTQKAGDLARYEQEANANTFTRPPDGAFTEDRLMKFLEVRKAVYAVYEAHRAELEGSQVKKQADLSDLMKFGSLIAEIKLAQAKAQAQVGMSDPEYFFMVTSVYGAAMNAGVQKESGKTMAQTFDEAAEQSRKAMEEATRQAGGAAGAGVSEAEAQLEKAKQQMATLGGPQSNIDLYRKHEDEIKKYTMQGLGMIGL